MRLGLVLFAALVGLAQTGSDYQHSIEKWRAQREADLKADDGWLTVVGLKWLKEGENRVERVGVVTLKNGTAWFNSQKSGAVELKPDTSGTPTVIALGRISFHV